MPENERPPVHGSGRYYRSQSDDALRHLIDGSMKGSSNYEGARAELDRRESDRNRKTELLWIKLTFAATVILGLLGIAATLAD